MYPKLLINLQKFTANAIKINQMCREAKIEMLAVLKAGAGSVPLASAALASGINNIADTKLQNIVSLRSAGIQANYTLLRMPMISELTTVVANVDCVYISQLDIARRIGEIALHYDKNQKIVLMLDMGDGREGLHENKVMNQVEDLLNMNGINLVGIGTSYACRDGVEAARQSLLRLTEIAEHIRVKYWVELECISGGSSASFELMLQDGNLPKGITQLRIGESLFLGCEKSSKLPLPNMYTDIFTLQAETVETYENDAYIVRCALGRHDIGGQLLFAKNEDVKILEIGDEYVTLEVPEKMEAGQVVEFSLSYSGLLTAMMSPFVTKYYI